MTDDKLIDRAELLTVRQAADRCRSSIPRFYSERNKNLLGFHDVGEGPWLISVGRLIDEGFLDSDGTPAKTARGRFRQRENAEATPTELDSARDELRTTHDQLEIVTGERDSFASTVDLQAKEIERLHTILAERDRELARQTDMVYRLAEGRVSSK